jgi:2',3'-cyclic-nucleotide 2'-phosphodiesterase (5'-nucleotidase family)
MRVPTGERAGPRLRIVSINDVYTLENLPRLRTLLRRCAEEDPADVLLAVVAGDFLAPSILSSLDSGRGMVECLDLLGMTHVTFGNHEDDVPVAELRARVRELNAKWLATNVHGFDPPLPAHEVVTVEARRDGGVPGRAVRVGLVGVVMDDAAVYRDAPFGGATLEPANAAVLREGAALMAGERCACVVPLTHQALSDDRALATAGGRPPIPVILGGHEHVVFLEQLAGTWIVKAGSDAVRAAIVDLTWPVEAPAARELDVPSVAVRIEPVAGYAEDAELRRMVDRHMAKVHALEVATLLTLEPGETLSSVGSRARQTTLGALVCSRLRDALGADACVFNAGGIRAARDYTGRFTYGDLKAEVPFDNEVVVVRMPGRVLSDAVAASRAHAPAESGGFLQVDDGVVVHEPGHRVVSVAGAPLDEDREYRVAMVRNFLEGMDHIEPLVRFAQEHPDRVPPPASGREAKIVLVEAFARALWKRLGGFDAVDANHDGKVTGSEIAEAVARATRDAPSEVAAELVLKAIDVKHQGAITRDEVEDLEKK